MAAPKAGDRLEDPDGNIWTVAEVLDGAPSRYAVRLERTAVVEVWAALDEIGPGARRYHPVMEPSDA